jgi:hypothetical protein
VTERAIDWARWHRACDDEGDAIPWLLTLPPETTINEAWWLCERADWLLWTLARVVHTDPEARDREYRLLACDCAERALALEIEAGRDIDPRSWGAVQVARRYAMGEATVAELDAARSAAWPAARSAGSAAWYAGSAAWYAGSASWYAARSAGYAGSAAGSAARSAWYAAGYAAMAAEHRWQCERIRARFRPVGGGR